MMNRVWKLGFAALSGVLVACSGGSGDVAGSSMETENSIALSLLLDDGTPAAKSKVLVRPAAFLAGANNFSLTDSFSELDSDSPVVVGDSAAGILNLETDEKGMLNLPRLKAGNYVIEARRSAGRAMKRVVVKDSVTDSLSMTIKASGAMDGRVYLPAGVKSATVGILGVDYFVETDSLGNFEFENLPAGDMNVVAFMYSTYESPGSDGIPVTFSRYQSLGVGTAKVVSEEKVEDVTIGALPVDSDTSDTDTAEVYPTVLFEDFEKEVLDWYVAVSEYGIGDLKVEEDSERDGRVAHFEYQNDSNYNWVLVGRALGGEKDFSELDSVVFWARAGLGDSTQWVSLSFDMLLDSLVLEENGWENGKAWVHLTLDTEWKRFVVTPGDLIETDSLKIGGNIGWDIVKTHVTNLNFFGGGVGGPFEIWLDDVEIFGVKDLE